MTMLGVVPGKECLAVSPGILNETETIREVRTIFKRLEVRFGEGVVIGNIRPTMSLDDFQIDQQGSDGLRSHAGAAIGVRRSAPARYIGQRRPGCVVSRWQRMADVGRSRPPRAALAGASALAPRAS